MADLIFESQQELDERVTYATLAKLSGIENPDKIYPGQKITLPGGGSYTVKKGDTLSHIAQDFRLGKIGIAKDKPGDQHPDVIPSSPKLDDPTTKLPQVVDKLGPDGQYDGDDLGNAPSTPPKIAGKLDDPTTKLNQISPKKKMGKLDDPTTKLPQVAEEEVEETVEVPVSALAELMQLAGYENYEDKLQEYENEPEEEYSDTEDQLIGLSGGLNGPKKAYAAAAGGDNPMNQEPTEIEEDSIASVEESLYKSYKAFLEEAEINEEEE